MQGDAIRMFTQTGSQQMSVEQNNVHVYSTTVATCATSGALTVSGGLAVASTENASSLGNGGALTVGGGASVKKDLFIGGNVYISGNLTASGAVQQPTVTFSNTQNCSFVTYGNPRLLTVSNQATLSFYVEVTPQAASENCQFEFDLPNRFTELDNRGELVATCTAYTNDTKPVPLFNVLCVGEKHTTRGLVKFQSVSTDVHYLAVLCTYTVV
jgi:hypothetical protein